MCVRIKCTRTHARSFDVRLLYAQFVAIGSCSSLKQEEYERAFTDPFLTNFSSKTDFRFREKKNGFRVLKKSGQLSSSFPRTPHCVSLSFPHCNQCFFIVLSLQSFRRAKKKRSLARSHSSSSGEFREVYTFCALRSEREGFCERCIQYKVRVERLTKIQIESHHGTFNALLSSSIGAFYVRFDPPTTAPSGTLEKYSICGDDDDAK